jgi:hypothetical protein
VIGRPHHSAQSLSRVVLDEMVADLVHEPVEQHEARERVARPLDSCPERTRLDGGTATFDPRARTRIKLTLEQPWRRRLFVQNNPARDLEASEGARANGVANGLAELDGAEPVPGQRTEECERLDDFAASDWVDEPGTTPTDANPWQPSVDVIGDLNSEVAGEATLTERR